MIRQVDCISRELVHRYGHDQDFVDEWVLTFMEELMEKVRTDPDHAAKWAHEIIKLEEQWS